MIKTSMFFMKSFYDIYVHIYFYHLSHYLLFSLYKKENKGKRRKKRRF